MKNLLKSLSLLAAFAAVSFASAQEQPPAGPPPAGPGPGGPGARPDRKAMAEHRIKELDEKLQLTAAQKQQVQAIFDKAEEQGKALRENDALSREDKMAKRMEIMKASHAEVRAVLTPDQQKTFDAMPPDRPRRGPRHDGDGKPADAPAPPAQQ